MCKSVVDVCDGQYNDCKDGSDEWGCHLGHGTLHGGLGWIWYYNNIIYMLTSMQQYNATETWVNKHPQSDNCAMFLSVV